MADDVVLNAGSGGDTIRADDDGTAKWQYVKLAYGADNTQTLVTAANGLTVQPDSGGFTVALSATDNAVLDQIEVNTSYGDQTGAGTEANCLRVTLPTDCTGVLSVDDNGGSLTVDNAALAVTGGGVESGALRVTIANDSTGVLSVDDGGGSITVDGTVSVSNLAGTHVDDAAFTAGTDDGVPAFAMFDDTTPDSVNEGDAGIVRMSANRNLYSTIRDAAGNERGANVNASNQLSVTGPVTNAGTFAVQVDGDALTALQLIDNPIVAHDAAASGSTGVDMAGALATNSVEGITQVANNDASRITSDLNGCLVTRNATTLEEVISERVSNTNGVSTAFTNFAAGGAGIHNYVTTISIYNSSATDGYVDLRDGTSGSVIFTAAAPATGGSIINLPVPLKGAANTALAYDVSGALSTVYISVVGFQAQG